MPLVTDVDEEDQAQNYPGVSRGSRWLWFLLYNWNPNRILLVLACITRQSRVHEWLSLIDVIVLKTVV